MVNPNARACQIFSNFLPVSKVPFATARTVDLLILGAGWTSTFLIPSIDDRNKQASRHAAIIQITYAKTTRDGRDGSIAFSYDQDGSEASQRDAFEGLPTASTILITFPLTTPGASEKLVKLYTSTRSSGYKDDEKQSKGPLLFIQLGTTSVWDGLPEFDDGKTGHVANRHTPINKSHVRGRAETELLALQNQTINGHKVHATVVNLSGLWGGERSIIRYVGRLAPDKDSLEKKQNVHMVHGLDVARALIAIHCAPDRASGQRWLLTDMNTYDWWTLVLAWGEAGSEKDKDGNFLPAKGPQGSWVLELMAKHDVPFLPRSKDYFQRSLSSREFWTTFELSPVKARLG